MISSSFCLLFVASVLFSSVDAKLQLKSHGVITKEDIKKAEQDDTAANDAVTNSQRRVFIQYHKHLHSQFFDFLQQHHREGNMVHGRRKLFRHGGTQLNSTTTTTDNARPPPHPHHHSPLQLHYHFPEHNAVVVTVQDHAPSNTTAASWLAKFEQHSAVKQITNDPKRYLMHQPDSFRRIPKEDLHKYTTQRTRKVGGKNVRHRGLQVVDNIPYGVELIQAPAAWDAGFTGKGISVCVIDTGLDKNHPEFSNKDVQAGWDIGDSGGSSGWENDGVGHGTHCSGSVAASSNSAGIVGVAPDANIFTVRVFDSQGYYAYASALLDAVKKCYEGGAQVISMSLGGPDFSQFEQDAFFDLYDSQVILVAAAGNDGTAELNYPASYEKVVGVAAVDSSKNVASFSQKNEEVEIAGPGVEILSTLPLAGSASGGPDYGILSGTSMATPHLAGVMALLKQYAPGLSTQTYIDAVTSTADDLGSSGRDTSYGYGLVNVVAALTKLGTSAGDTSGGDTSGGGGDSSGGGSTSDPSSGQCASNEYLVAVQVQTDTYPEEAFWQVDRNSDNYNVMRSTGMSASSFTETPACIPNDGSCYTFTISDSGGDGLCCDYGSGGYAVLVDGQVVTSGNVFQFYEQATFGTC